jgi:hypothetical protein
VGCGRRWTHCGRTSVGSNRRGFLPTEPPPLVDVRPRLVAVRGTSAGSPPADGE